MCPFVRKRIPLTYACRNVWAALSACRCPRLPHVVATYEMPDEFVVVCDYVPGDTLVQRIDEQGSFDLSDAAGVLAQLCEAVGALHEQGIVHRDIAPANVVLATQGAHLIDLGAARMLSDTPIHDSKQGTWGFAAPEQFGFAPADTRADTYALGKVAAYMLTGIMPDEKAGELAFTQTSELPMPVREVLARACAYGPSARYQTVQELAEAFSRAVAAAQGGLDAVCGGAVGGVGASGADTAGTGSIFWCR